MDYGVSDGIFTSYCMVIRLVFHQAFEFMSSASNPDIQVGGSTLLALYILHC